MTGAELTELDKLVGAVCGVLLIIVGIRWLAGGHATRHRIRRGTGTLLAIALGVFLIYAVIRAEL